MSIYRGGNMYIPNPLPTGSVFVYLIRDKKREWFKVGWSERPKRRSSEVGGKVYHQWEFIQFFTALYVEQTLIQLLQNHGYKRLSSDDWFEIDEDAVKVVMQTATS